MLFVINDNNNGEEGKLSPEGMLNLALILGGLSIVLLLGWYLLTH